MIKTQADLRNHNIIGRERAALIASTASRFQSTLTLERDGIVLNLKSMIGLLSQTCLLYTSCRDGSAACAPRPPPALQRDRRPPAPVRPAP